MRVITHNPTPASAEPTLSVESTAKYWLRVALDVPLDDLFDYYQKYYGNSVISSSGQSSGLDIKPNDLEYQVTWYDNNMIKITELTPDGIIKYQCVAEGERTSINIRYVMKN